MEKVIISKELSYKCAQALVKEHNSIPEENDSCILVSFRSLYAQLRELGYPNMIATARKPRNNNGLPLFPEKVEESRGCGLYSETCEYCG